MATFEKTYNGTVKTNEDGSQMQMYFKFLPEDVDKFIVIKWRYEQHMFFGALFGTQLSINGHKLSPNEDLDFYGVYKIEWHSDWQKKENNMGYKVKLTPVGNYMAWCPNRSWYTSDMESHINKTYNLFEENPVFETFEEAHKFACDKNFELYPESKSILKTIFAWAVK